jgi:hypothetical protein
MRRPETAADTLIQQAIPQTNSTFLAIPFSNVIAMHQRALLAGYQIHVSKPVEPAELLTVCASLSRDSVK